jgi:uncharacterized protein (UPF0335 family)
MPLKVIQADTSLKSKIDRYVRLNQELKALEKEIEPIKESFKELGECDIKFGDRLIATQKQQDRKEFMVKASSSLVFRIC